MRGILTVPAALLSIVVTLAWLFGLAHGALPIVCWAIVGGLAFVEGGGRG